MMIPTTTLMLPSAVAERIWPPIMQSTTLKKYDYELSVPHSQTNTRHHTYPYPIAPRI